MTADAVAGRTYFIANIGTTDVMVNLGSDEQPDYLPLAKDFSPDRRVAERISSALGSIETGTRAWAAKLRETLDQWRSRLAFPKVVPALENAFRTAGHIDTVLLAGTDQDDPHHRPWDSVEAAHVIIECLRPKYEATVRDWHFVRSDGMVHRHDDAAEEARRILDEIPDSPRPRIYLALKGGIPALSAALLQQVLSRFPDAVVIEVDEPSAQERRTGQSGAVRRADTWLVRQSRVVRLARVLVDRYDYAGMRLLLEEEGVRAPLIEAVLAHAAARLDLDFDRAASHLKGILDEPYRSWWASVIDERHLQRIRDIASVCEFRLETQEYFSFVTTCATFCELTRRHIIWRSKNVWLEDRVAYKRVQNSFGGLKLSPPRGEGSERDWTVTKAILDPMLRWCRKNVSAHRGAINCAMQQLDLLAKVENMRNGGLHRAKGVGEKEIVNALGPDAPRRLSESRRR